MKNFIVTAALLASAAVAQASPIKYNFSYDVGADTLSGSLMGELQADQNTIVISSVLNFAQFNGVDGAALPWVTSITTLYTGVFQAATTTLDGTAQDFYAATYAFGELGFFLGNGPGLPLDHTFLGGKSYGDREDGYNGGDWGIHAVAVPEPASLLLMLAGLGLVGLAVSRRKA